MTTNNFILCRMLSVWCLFVASCYGWSAAALASNTFSIQPGMLHFHYTETDTDGSFLDSESGAIPGLTASYQAGFPSDMKVKFGISQYTGETNYNGYTGAGVPHQTDTDVKLRSLSADLFIPVFGKGNSIELMLGLNVNEWERDIQPVNGISGLYELYTWYGARAGFEFMLYKSDVEEYRVHATMIRVIKPRVEVDLTSLDYGNPVLDLQEKNGFDIGTDWSYAINRQWWFGVSLSYHYWQFGRSDDKVLTGSTGTTIIAEPDSETKLAAFHLLISSHF